MHKKEVCGIVLSAFVLSNTSCHGNCGNACGADQRIDLAAGNDIHQLAEEHAEQLVADPAIAAFFEKASALCGQPKKVANVILGMLMREVNAAQLDTASLAIQPEAVAELVALMEKGTISAKIAADIFPELMKGGIMPEALVKERGLVQVSDTGAIDAAVQKVMAANPAEVEAYRGGKTKLISFFVGQVMREMRGKANPAVVNEALAKFLG